MSQTYWYVVETRVRSEYAAAAEIAALPGDLEAFVPQEVYKRRTRTTPVKALRPMFPGFIFVGSKVPPILDVDSRDHPHPIFRVRNATSVRALVRSPGGGVHPIRLQFIDGQLVNIVDWLRGQEAAGALDLTNNDVEPQASPEPVSTSVKYAGGWGDQWAVVMARRFPDVALRAA